MRAFIKEIVPPMIRNLLKSIKNGPIKFQAGEFNEGQKGALALIQSIEAIYTGFRVPEGIDAVTRLNALICNEKFWELLGEAGPLNPEEIRTKLEKQFPHLTPKRRINIPKKYFGVNKIDQKMEKYLNYNDGYFVELGANDGENQSNTLYLERYRNWKGVLIEPTPHNYLLCRANRSVRTQIFCNACTSFEYKEKFVEIVYSNLMSTPIGLESDIANPFEQAKMGKQYLKRSDDNFIFGSLAKPLNNILCEAGAPPLIDLLSLDVEGAEIEVLKGIDHSRYKFKYLCIESRSKEKLIDYLSVNGYQFIEQLFTNDYLFGANLE